jgi:hypothetical protein
MLVDVTDVAQRGAAADQKGGAQDARAQLRRPRQDLHAQLALVLPEHLPGSKGSQ